MSREIKFRAWHKTRLAWIAGFNMFGFSNFHGGDKHLQRFGSEFPYESVNIEQFTGLQDKNGVDIYEGDIIGLANDWGLGPKPVWWNIKTASWNVGPEWFLGALCDRNVVKVIGNIHENPELLEPVT